jgi:transcriptional regulator with XRE-family HTH domain
MSTQEAMAKAAGIDRTYFSKILHAHLRPSVELAVRIYRTSDYKFGPLQFLSDDDAKELCRLIELADYNENRGNFL